MSPAEFTDAAAIALAPSFRERFDFTNEAHYAQFAELTWKAAKALEAARPKPPEPLTPIPIYSAAILKSLEDDINPITDDSGKVVGRQSGKAYTPSSPEANA